MGRMTAAMLTEANRLLGAAIWPIIDVELSDGARKWTDVPGGVRAGTLGYHEEKVLSWSDLTFEPSSPVSSPTLPTLEWEVTVSDRDYDLTHFIASKGFDEARGAEVTARWIFDISGSGSEDDWFTQFVGIVSSMKPVEGSGELRYVLSLRVDDDAYRRDFMSDVITESVFPDADPEVYGTPTPLVYGEHAGEGLAVGGMLPALYTDRNNFRYMASRGYTQPTRVFSNNIEKIPTTDYTVDYLTLAGKLYTFITFLAEQGTNIVTWDGLGYDTNADGTGTLIANTAVQLKHIINNFGVGDYKSGRWLPENTAKLSVSAWNESRDFLAAQSSVGSRYISQSMELRVIVENWLSAHRGFAAFWTNFGELAIRPNDPFAISTYSDRHIRWDQEPDTSEATPFYDDSALITGVDIDLLRGESDDKFFRLLHLRDPLATEGLVTSMQHPWVVAKAF